MCILLIEICVAFERHWTVIKYAPVSQFTKEQKFPQKKEAKVETEEEQEKNPLHLFRLYIYYRLVSLISIYVLCANRPSASVCDTDRVSSEPRCQLKRLQL